MPPPHQFFHPRPSEVQRNESQRGAQTCWAWEGAYRSGLSFLAGVGGRRCTGGGGAPLRPSPLTGLLPAPLPRGRGVSSCHCTRGRGRGAPQRGVWAQGREGEAAGAPPRRRGRAGPGHATALPGPPALPDHSPPHHRT